MTRDKWVSPEVITEIVWALFFHDIQINLGRKNILCIFTNRILLEAMTSGKISLHKKLPCTYVVFLGVCLYVWWDTRKFSLLLLSTPLFCLSQNKYCDSWITHWMPVFILWSWLLNKRSTPVHTFQCLSPFTHLTQMFEAQQGRIFPYLFRCLGRKKGSSLQAALYINLLEDVFLFYKMYLNKSVSEKW